METVQAVAEPVNTRQPRANANRERYQRVDRSWPEFVPALTEAEAIAVSKRLWRTATGKPWEKNRKISFTSGNRHSQFAYNSFVINCDPHRRGIYGWKWLVHTISHRTHRIVNKGHDHHGLAHASHEAWLVHEVVSRGWLDGRFKRQEKAKPAVDTKQVRYKRIVARIAAWQTKAKRAETALKKLRKQKTYYERQVMI